MAVKEPLMNPLELAAFGPVIPVMVIHRLQDAVPLAQALLEGGVRVLEITLRTPVALACMREIAAHCPRPSSARAPCARWPTCKRHSTPVVASA